MAQYLLRLLSDTVDAARPLYETDNGPRQVVVHHDVTVLEVLALAQHVCGDQDSKRLIGFTSAGSAIAFRAESKSQTRGIVGIAGDASHVGDTSLFPTRRPNSRRCRRTG